MGDYIVESKEEAIKMLKTALKEGAMIKGNFRYALAEGIIALEKQIPKKAEYHHKVDGECALTVCPNCENRVIVTRFAFPLDRYCKECGQHYVVDIANWEVEE